MTLPLFYQADILSAEQFNQKTLAAVFTRAKKMEKMLDKHGASDELHGKIMTALFYEPSSRTFGSFIAAMQRLGGGIIPIQGVTYSSVSKGETLPDTVRTFAQYSDVIVIRHPDLGASKLAAEFSPVPVINAGDGIGEHPTQALLDLFTIVKRFGKVESLTVSLIGDLLNGRTIHSLLKLLAQYPKVKVNLVSPTVLQLPENLKQRTIQAGVELFETDDLHRCLPTSDVLYVTRVQKERFTDLDLYEATKHHYVITPEIMKYVKKTAILLHPLPRVGEISMEVDHDPRAIYLTEQIRNGLAVRMALLSLLFQHV